MITLDDPERRGLSFRNLVELHVLAALRRRHNISLQAVRKAVRFTEDKLKVSHPLASKRMLTDGKDLLLDRSGLIVNLSQEGQLELRSLVEAYLERIVHSANGKPLRLFPFTTPNVEEANRLVVIDPRIQFGRPCVAERGVPTIEVAERYKAGESIESLCKDFGLKRPEVEEAIRYELQLAA